ncbi:facilitated trehalose transporter Tret1-like isoform X1 [Cimex lectularius]|uniref:Major facilitator superfamily (MFS) profile domain-containing protein n=2 Tax=Cimex lectularius TaxID=79782 RepID=A0A8I6RYA0_CIMLE|nr:facilitated trehalose transporter Tret1-like isoform X1 [Cimex lectularius]
MQRILPGKYGSKINVAIVALNSFVAGLCAAWPSAIFPIIINKSHLVHLNLDEISLSVIFLYVGQLVSLLPFSTVESAIGKAKTLEFGIIFAILGWVVIILFVNNLGIYFAMLLFGCWLTICFLSNGPYLAEVSPPRLRGRTLALMSIFYMLGAITEITMSIFLSYKGLALANFALTIFQFSLLFSLPETPYYYLRKYNIRTAFQRFEWFRGSGPSNKKEFDDAVTFTEKQMNASSKLTDVCRDFSTRKALFFSLTMACFQKTSANTPLQTYCGILLPNSFIKSAMFPLLFFSVSAVFNILSALFIDRFGRRKLLLISASGSCTLSICSAVWFFVQERTHTVLNEHYNFIPYMTLILETAFYSLGVQYIPGVINGELFAVHIKSKALSIISLVQITVNIINSKIFIVLVQNKLTFLSFTVYSIVSAVSFFYHVSIFDTKGKTLEEIYNHFERKGRRRSTLVANLLPQKDGGSILPSEERFEDEKQETSTPKDGGVYRLSWTFGNVSSDIHVPYRKRSSSVPNSPSVQTEKSRSPSPVRLKPLTTQKNEPNTK